METKFFKKDMLMETKFFKKDMLISESKIDFSLPQLTVWFSTEQINLFLAGVASGKTHLDGLLSYNFIQKFPSVRGFIGANTYDQLNTSTIFRIREVWKSFGVVEYDEKSNIGHYVVNKQPPKAWNLKGNFISYDKIISFCNGAIVFVGSMDNAKAHDGKEFGWAILDETKDTKEDDVKDIILARLRQPGIYVKDGEFTSEVTDKACCPLYISTSPAKVDWINNWFELEKDILEIEEKIYKKDDFFVKRSKGKLCVISSTYHNEHHLPANYIDSKKDHWTKEKFKTLIYGNPFSQTGSEYYSSFDRIKNVGRTEYDPNIPLHISFDFNYVPYNSCSIWQVKQVENTYFVYGIDEIALKNPRNSDEEVCNAFLSRYQHKHKSTLFIYGDATGKAGTTINKEFKSHIENLEKYLRPMIQNSSMRIPRGNPTNNSRRDFINRIFEEKVPIRIFVGENMQYMIADLSYTLQDLINGGKDKHIVTDKETGDRYQKYGHFGDNCFVGETLIETKNGSKRIDSLNPGDYVLTRNGYKKIKRVFNNGIKHVAKYKIGNISITCTPEHKFYTYENDFISVSRIESNTFCIFEEKQICKKKLSVTVVNLMQEYGEQRIVYDLEIEDTHEYFANGILVHNCEYFLCECFKPFFLK